ncbi:MAG: DUF4231 domain-containing protein [Anaerolineaceae bacterium]|nr:DUF4231 domain-containing protein [Anaerolineaceae bacterium]
MATQETDKPVKSDTPKMTAPPVKARLSTPVVETEAAKSSQDMPIATPPTDVRLVTGQMPAVAAAVTPDDATVFVPDPKWPPPILIDGDAKTSERYYMEHRWYGQWKYYDQRAEHNKQRYLLLQRIIVIGSVSVPVLISVGPSVQNGIGEAYGQTARLVLDFITIVLSLAVAIAAGIERLYKYGEYWSSYRNAAEELMQEKALYDTRSGPYKDSETPFLDFVKFTEDIVAQQNGRWIQSRTNQYSDATRIAQGIMDGYGDEFVGSIGTKSGVSYSSPIPPNTG